MRGLHNLCNRGVWLLDCRRFDSSSRCRAGTVSPKYRKQGEPVFDTNEYFDGKVKSIAFNTGGDAATIGVMAAGEYEFGNSHQEINRPTRP